MLELTRELYRRVRAVHRAGALVVDMNEMNFLVDSRPSPHLRDRRRQLSDAPLPATAITPAIADPLVRHGDFTELSDWYSFAVLSFQLLVGVHPFKGRHPTVKTLEERMRLGLSAFRPEVSLPAVAYPLDHIPSVLADWLRAVLDRGQRVRPPALDGVHAPAIVCTPPPLQASGDLDVTLLTTLPATIRALLGGDGMWADVSDGLYLDGRRMAPSPPPGARLAITPRRGQAVIVHLDGRRVRLREVRSGLGLACELEADRIASSEGHVFLKSRDRIFALVLHDLGSRVIASTRWLGNALPKATRLFDGVAIMSLLGACYATLLWPDRCHALRLEELDGLAVVDARREGGVLMVLARCPDGYRRYAFRVDPRSGRYDVQVSSHDTPQGLDFVTLASGICVSHQDSELVLFSSRPGSAERRRIDDGALPAGALLATHHGKVLCFEGERVYRVSTR